MESFYKPIGVHGLSDYCKGVMYASGCMIKEENTKYLSVRNLDKWYAECIGKETGYTHYPSMHNIKRDGRPQWTVKSRNITEMPDISSAKNPADFIRPYLELHSTLDTVKAKSTRKVRLRIYGKEEFLSIIMRYLPAKPKKIQKISNKVLSEEKEYTGKTCAIYYQSCTEIEQILNYINGYPRNDVVWDKWCSVMDETDT